MELGIRFEGCKLNQTGVMLNWAFFALLSLVVLTCSEASRDNCFRPRTALRSKLVAGRKLSYHSVRAVPVLSAYHCADVCLRDVRCKSFNFVRKRDDDDMNVCEINDVTWEQAEHGVVHSKKGTDFYDVDFQGLRTVGDETSCSFFCRLSLILFDQLYSLCVA